MQVNSRTEDARLFQYPFRTVQQRCVLGSGFRSVHATNTTNDQENRRPGYLRSLPVKSTNHKRAPPGIGTFFEASMMAFDAL